MKLINKGTRQQTQQQVIEESNNNMVGRKPIAPAKKKDINVKVTKETRRKLRDIGKIAEDYGDVVDSLIDFYNANRGKPGVEERRIKEEEEDATEEKEDEQ